MRSRTDWDKTELQCLRLFIRGLPRVRGADYVIRKAWNFYTRKKRLPVLTSCFAFKMILDPMDRGEEQLLLGCQHYNYREIGFMEEFFREKETCSSIWAHTSECSH